MKLEKYHGCGNDFVITEYKDSYDCSKMAIKYCNRKTGIGADGMIFVKKNPLEMVFYNADGSRAPMCGNGIRCFAYYCYLNNLVSEKEFDVVTLAGVMKIKVTSVEPFIVRVNMGSPIYGSEAIKFAIDANTLPYSLKVDDKDMDVYSFFMGTIHTMVLADDINKAYDSDLGEKICNHQMFKEKTNVNFVKVIDKENIIVRTFERGVGKTLACGTGACASVVLTNTLGLTNGKCNVLLELGTLTIEVLDSVFMSGPAVKVFETIVEGE